MLPGGTEIRFALVNAVHFKADWREPFEKRATRPEPFYPQGGPSYPVATMHQEQSFPYLESDLVQVLALPYIGTRFSMVILLPKRRDGLAEVAKKFGDSTLGVELGALKPALTSVSLPKFTIAGPAMDLGSPLRALGMRRVFDSEQADLGGISRERPLWIDVALHKAWIQVDEKGTEAAAVTGAMAGGAMEVEPGVVEFRADHPFLFLIWDRMTASPLFVGQLVAPAAAE